MASVKDARQYVDVEMEKSTESLRMAEQRLQDLATARRILDECGEAPEDSTASDSPEYSDSDAEYPDLMRLDVNMAGAINQKQQLFRIAEATGGCIHTLRAAEYLVAKGYSKSKVGNLRANLHAMCSEDEDFVKTGVNRFRLLRESDDLLTVPGSESADSLLQ